VLDRCSIVAARVGNDLGGRTTGVMRGRLALGRRHVVDSEGLKPRVADA
jgi:hypothetical protein